MNTDTLVDDGRVQLTFGGSPDESCGYLDGMNLYQMEGSGAVDRVDPDGFMGVTIPGGQRPDIPPGPRRRYPPYPPSPPPPPPPPEPLLPSDMVMRAYCPAPDVDPDKEALDDWLTEESVTQALINTFGFTEEVAYFLTKVAFGAEQIAPDPVEMEQAKARRCPTTQPTEPLPPMPESERRFIESLRK